MKKTNDKHRIGNTRKGGVKEGNIEIVKGNGKVLFPKIGSRYRDIP